MRRIRLTCAAQSQRSGTAGRAVRTKEDVVITGVGKSGWVLVDVETTGTNARRDRVLSLATMTLDYDGRVEDEYATLLNPGV